MGSRPACVVFGRYIYLLLQVCLFYATASETGAFPAFCPAFGPLFVIFHLASECSCSHERSMAYAAGNADRQSHV